MPKYNHVPKVIGVDKDDNQGRASDRATTDNYASTQGKHGDPLGNKVTSEGEQADDE